MSVNDFFFESSIQKTSKASTSTVAVSSMVSVEITWPEILKSFPESVATNAPSSCTSYGETVTSGGS